MPAISARNPLIQFFQVLFVFAFTVMVMVSVLFAVGGEGIKSLESAGWALLCFGALAFTEYLTTGRWFRWQRRTPRGRDSRR